VGTYTRLLGARKLFAGIVSIDLIDFTSSALLAFF
jgi:hypothetical protein